MKERHFVPQAIFERPISYFADRMHLAITTGYDDLDHYESLGFLLENTIPVLMIHHMGYPAGTTTMQLPFELADPKLIATIVGMVASGFDLPAEAVSWQRQAGAERLAS